MSKVPTSPSPNLSFVQFLFQQLGNIISIIKQHARNYMPEIFTVIRVRWCAHGRQ